MSHVLNIAHRGFTRVFPDNTLEAFEAAIQIGADGIECDVHETADHEFVVFHDAELSGRDIVTLSLGEIQAVRLEEKFGIPTLEQTLALCRGRVRSVVELKRVYSLDRLIALVRAILGPTEAVLTSFNPELVSAAARLAPEIPTGIVTAFAVTDPIGLAQSTGSDLIVVRSPFASAELAEELHAHSLSLFVWGCADGGDVRDALVSQVDGIISDFPELVARELRGAP